MESQRPGESSFPVPSLLEVRLSSMIGSDIQGHFDVLNRSSPSPGLPGDADDRKYAESLDLEFEKLIESIEEKLSEDGEVEVEEEDCFGDCYGCALRDESDWFMFPCEGERERGVSEGGEITAEHGEMCDRVDGLCSKEGASLENVEKGAKEKQCYPKISQPKNMFAGLTNQKESDVFEGGEISTEDGEICNRVESPFLKERPLLGDLEKNEKENNSSMFPIDIKASTECIQNCKEKQQLVDKCSENCQTGRRSCKSDGCILEGNKLDKKDVEVEKNDMEFIENKRILNGTIFYDGSETQSGFNLGNDFWPDKRNIFYEGEKSSENKRNHIGTIFNDKSDTLIGFNFGNDFLPDKKFIFNEEEESLGEFGAAGEVFNNSKISSKQRANQEEKIQTINESDQECKTQDPFSQPKELMFRGGSLEISEERTEIAPIKNTKASNAIIDAFTGSKICQQENSIDSDKRLNIEREDCNYEMDLMKKTNLRLQQGRSSPRPAPLSNQPKFSEWPSLHKRDLKDRIKMVSGGRLAEEARGLTTVPIVSNPIKACPFLTKPAAIDEVSAVATPSSQAIAITTNCYTKHVNTQQQAETSTLTNLTLELSSNTFHESPVYNSTRLSTRLSTYPYITQTGDPTSFIDPDDDIPTNNEARAIASTIRPNILLSSNTFLECPVYKSTPLSTRLSTRLSQYPCIIQTTNFTSLINPNDVTTNNETTSSIRPNLLVPQETTERAQLQISTPTATPFDSSFIHDSGKNSEKRPMSYTSSISLFTSAVRVPVSNPNEDPTATNSVFTPFWCTPSSSLLNRDNSSQLFSGHPQNVLNSTSSQTETHGSVVASQRLVSEAGKGLHSLRTTVNKTSENDTPGTLRRPSNHSGLIAKTKTTPTTPAASAAAKETIVFTSGTLTTSDTTTTDTFRNSGVCVLGGGIRSDCDYDRPRGGSGMSGGGDVQQEEEGCVASAINYSLNTNCYFCKTTLADHNKRTNTTPLDPNTCTRLTSTPLCRHCSRVSDHRNCDKEFIRKELASEEYQTTQNEVIVFRDNNKCTDFFDEISCIQDCDNTNCDNEELFERRPVLEEQQTGREKDGDNTMLKASSMDDLCFFDNVWSPTPIHSNERGSPGSNHDGGIHTPRWRKEMTPNGEMHLHNQGITNNRNEFKLGKWEKLSNEPDDNNNINNDNNGDCLWVEDENIGDTFPTTKEFLLDNGRTTMTVISKKSDAKDAFYTESRFAPRIEFTENKTEDQIMTNENYGLKVTNENSGLKLANEKPSLKLANENWIKKTKNTNESKKLIEKKNSGNVRQMTKVIESKILRNNVYSDSTSSTMEPLSPVRSTRADNFYSKNPNRNNPYLNSQSQTIFAKPRPERVVETAFRHYPDLLLANNRNSLKENEQFLNINQERNDNELNHFKEKYQFKEFLINTKDIGLSPDQNFNMIETGNAFLSPAFYSSPKSSTIHSFSTEEEPSDTPDISEQCKSLTDSFSTKVDIGPFPKTPENEKDFLPTPDIKKSSEIHVQLSLPKRNVRLKSPPSARSPGVPRSAEKVFSPEFVRNEQNWRNDDRPDGIEEEEEENEHPGSRSEIDDCTSYVVTQADISGKRCNGRINSRLVVNGNHQRTPEKNSSVLPAHHGKPVVLFPLKDEESVPGEPLTLQCEVIGSPEPEVTWKFEDILLDGQEPYESHYDGRVAILQLSELLPSDEGIYTCLARNNMGQCETNARITVVGFAPDIYQPLDSVKAEPGLPVSLNCRAKADPSPRVFWSFNGQPLESNDNIKLSNDGDLYKMEIGSLRKEHFGSYGFQAINPFGDAICTACIAESEKIQRKPENKLIQAIRSNMASKLCQKTPIFDCLETLSLIEDLPVDKYEDEARESLTHSDSTKPKEADFDIKNLNDGNNKDLFNYSPNPSGPKDENRRSRVDISGFSSVMNRAAKQLETTFREADSEEEPFSVAKSNPLTKQPILPTTVFSSQQILTTSWDFLQTTTTTTTTMTSYDQIEDEDELQEMMSKVENFEERKKIRARIREIREKKVNDAKTDKKPTDAASTSETKNSSQTSTKPGDANKENIDKKDGAVEKAKADDNAPKETTETTSVTSKDGKTTTVTTVQTITDKNETRVITTEVVTKTMPDGGTSTKTSKRTKIIQNQMGFGGAMAAPGGLAPGGRGRGVTRSPSAIKQMLLEWTKAMTQEYSDKVVITNFSSSWNNGLAFCALIHHFYPDAFDFDALDPKKRRHNFDLAFNTAEKLADIAPLLDTDDMVRMKNPDWKCVFTYVQSFYRKLMSHERNKAMPKPEKVES